MSGRLIIILSDNYTSPRPVGLFVVSTLPTVPIARTHRGEAAEVTNYSCELQSVTLYTELLIMYSNVLAQHGQKT
jgi:hypothetical protein